MFKFLSKASGVVGYVIKYGCITHCTFEYLGDFVWCSGPSMEPTLYTDNILFTERITPKLHTIQRGDIIIAKSPSNPVQRICKRVVGLPGDRISVQSSFNFNPFSSNSKYSKKSQVEENEDEDDSHVVIEDDRNFQMKQTQLKSGEFLVPRGHVWIEGDNAENSSDSRYYGPIPQGLICSRAVVRVWPLQSIRMLT